MEIELKASTGNFKSVKDMLYFSRICGRHCYSKKDWEELEKETYNPKFIEGLIQKGHHSVFEHVNLTFSMKGLPKILAMVLNNEKQYATSEKSARYTQMKAIEEQEKKYDKWMEVFQVRTKEECPESSFPKLYIPDDREYTPIFKLAQENSRYMTSVFTPTKMVHTFNLRQLNYIYRYIEEFIEKFGNKNIFNKRLSRNMEDFLDSIREFRIDGLNSQTDRHLSFFGNPVEEHFGDVYSTNYFMSFACLGQAHRHRTINYQVTEEIELGAEHGFHIPKIIRDTKLEKEWLKDLKKIAKDDFPQAQLIPISERGTLENFRSKLLLRLCGHAQHEIMERTLKVAKKYSQKYYKFKESYLKPKCQQGMKCKERCVFGGEKALERVI
jgi:thymidylate synthase ThyX